MAEKYYGISPYAYCAGNPVNLVDMKGKKIVFVNGLLALGSTQGGAIYWNGEQSPFVTKAKTILADNNLVFLDVKHKWYSSAKRRYKTGYQFAKDNIDYLTSNLEEGESFKFVTHSMGAAYAEGMAKYLLEEGYSVEMLFHFSPYQAAQIRSVGSDPDILTIDFQTIGDPVLFLDGMGTIRGADYRIIDFPDNGINYLHRESIDNSDTWEQIIQFIHAFINR